MINDQKSHATLVGLIAIYKEYIGLYEALTRDITTHRVALQSILEDVVAQARMFKQGLIEALSGYGALADTHPGFGKLAFYDTWRTRIMAIRDVPTTTQLIRIEEALKEAYEGVLDHQLLDGPIYEMLLSQYRELDYNVAKLRLVIRNTSNDS